MVEAAAGEQLFTMPSLGADMEAGRLVAWKVGVGDAVKRGDIVAEVETEKGLIEVEVFADGVVRELLVEPGAKVPVGTALARIGGAAESGAAAGGEAETDGAGAGGAARVDVADAPAAAPGSAPGEAIGEPVESVGETAYGAAPGKTKLDGAPSTPAARREAREKQLDVGGVRGSGSHGRVGLEDARGAEGDAGGARVASAAATGARGEGSAAEAGRVRATPVARRRAEERGVDLGAVEGSGRDGVILLADVEKAPVGVTGPAKTKAASPAEAMRAAIGAAMARSKREIPHYYLTHTIDLGAAMSWLEARNADRPPTERVVPAALLVKATALALKKVPELNAWWTGSAAPPKAEVNVGVAISLRGGGLVAPAIPGTDQLGLDALMAAMSDVVERARRGALRASEMGSATVTVTSLGDRGVESVIPVIIPPQVAIVGFGTPSERPWVVDGEVVPRTLVTASVAGDHRVTDGHHGARLLARIEKLLQKPEKLDS